MMAVGGERKDDRFRTGEERGERARSSSQGRLRSDLPPNVQHRSSSLFSFSMGSSTSKAAKGASRSFPKSPLPSSGSVNFPPPPISFPSPSSRPTPPPPPSSNPSSRSQNPPTNPNSSSSSSTQHGASESKTEGQSFFPKRWFFVPTRRS